MPAARNGDFLIQVHIADWLGASHWSKPRPVKLPGVTGLAAYAGALGRAPSERHGDGGDQARSARVRDSDRGSIGISRNVGK